ncbi:antiviral helicase, partial [Endogone sp. FLAS-F59071]
MQAADDDTLLEQVFHILRDEPSDGDVSLPAGLGVPLSQEQIKHDLEQRFLIPKTAFAKEWLARCQQHWHRDPDLSTLYHTESSRPRTTLEFVRRGAEGEVVGYREVKIPDMSLTAKNSTSLRRDPGAIADFVRGKGNYFPFTPGGLESEIMVVAAEDVANEAEAGLLDPNEGLLTVPPGFERGLIFDDKEDQIVPTTGTATVNDPTSTFSIEDMIRADNGFELDLLEPIPGKEDIVAVERDQIDIEPRTPPPPKDALEKEVDSLLPVQPLPLLDARASQTKTKDISGGERKREWAHVVDVNERFDNFHEVVPEMAHEYPYELDVFQKQAVYRLEIGESVFVAAHTSAGKTAVAEYAIALAGKHMTKAIYTSPIKALSNQKFRDFRHTFGNDVGILTGDVQIKPEASCLIMTTEILRSMLYRGADLIRDVEFVIFDEVHYVNDQERGVVWEEIIIMLPAHVNLILLSATVPNTKEFADWVGRTKKKDIYVISTPKRPIPLEHFLYAKNQRFKIVDSKKQWLLAGWKDANDALSKKDKELKGATPASRGSRGSRGGGGGRGGSRGGGRGGGTGNFQQMDLNVWNHMIDHLSKKELLPAVIFTFSKRMCEEYAKNLSNIDLCKSSEKSKVHLFIKKSLSRLHGDDQTLPQILRMRDLLSRGIAVHHGGLLPIIKEIVEFLFAEGLVKVLFATETFAMGVNMPARTVVFSGFRKHDGKCFRDLLPGEYTQMSGRAGRRGLDKTGVVIIACSGDAAPEPFTLQQMILGRSTKLESRFRLTYNMILNLLRVQALKVEEMIKRSFSENTSQKLLPDQQRSFAEKEESLNALQKLDCTICNADIEKFYEVSSRVVNLNRTFLEKVMKSVVGAKTLNSGRIVAHRNAVAILLRPAPSSSKLATAGPTMTGQDKSFYFIILIDRSKKQDAVASPEGMLPLPVTRVSMPDSTSSAHEIAIYSYTDIVVITKTSIKVDLDAILDKQDEVEIARVTQELLRYAVETNKTGLVENDYSKIKDFDFQQHYRERLSLLDQMNKFQCTRCPDLNEHYGLVHKQNLLKTQIEDLKVTISDQNLELLPDYQQRIEVLKVLNFIDTNGTVQLKGRVACEISSADELILTELILDNILGDFEPAEIVALLSCFVFQEKNAGEPNLTPKLIQGKKIILDIATRVAKVQKSCNLDVQPEEYIRGLKFGLVEVVYEWARGMSFKNITDLTETLEGSIVRCISRLDETCREVKGAARMIGDSSLFKKMEEAEQMIKRDIVFAASLVSVGHTYLSSLLGIGVFWRIPLYL